VVKPDLVILHTSDFHNRLPPAAARQLADLKLRHPGCLLLDAGDAIRAGNLGVSASGEPILRQMAAIGYDAMALGNRESHLTYRLLFAKLRNASFPVLAANLRPRRDQPVPELVCSHAFFERPSGRVAVIGLAPQMIPPTSVWARVTDYVFDDPVTTAAVLAVRLRPEADLVICLSHCGARAQSELARLPGVDLVLGGHTHRALIEQRAGQALVVRPGHRASHNALTHLTCRADAHSELIALEQGS